MTPTTTPTSTIVRAPAELRLLHRRALHATAAVIDRALLYAADDPTVDHLVRQAARENLWAAEHLGRWSAPALPRALAPADAYRRSVDLVDEAACRPGALEVAVPLAGGTAVGCGADLLAERIVALDRIGRALARAASVHRTVDADLDLVAARLAVAA